LTDVCGSPNFLVGGFGNTMQLVTYLFAIHNVTI
jgi:hypothetical protein